MKFLFIIFFVCICLYVGYFTSKKYRQRYQFFNAITLLCHKFDVEINFSRERVKNIFMSLDEKLKGQLNSIDKNYIDYLSNHSMFDKDLLFKNISFLKENEKDLIFMFFKTLGRSDLDSQSKEIKTYAARFEDLCKTSQQENKKYGAFSIKLSIIASLLVFVLFI